MKKNEKINIILQSFLPKIITDEWREINSEELRHICQRVDYNKIPDRNIADNESLHEFVLWEKMDRMKIVRVVARNARIAGLVDLSKYNYKVKEVSKMLRICPYLIDRLSINLDKISSREAFVLLTIGAKEISDRIDIKKYNFTAQEIYEILELNNFTETIINDVDLKKLKDYHIGGIIINTGDLYFNVLDLKKLTARRWLDILEKRPEMLCYCDLEKFNKSDIFNSVELICMFVHEDLDFLIKNRDYQKELSAFGWEKLLVNKPNEYMEICSQDKLNEANWKAILDAHPRLLSYKNRLDLLT